MIRGTAWLLLVVAAAGCAGPEPEAFDKHAKLASFDWWDNRDFDWYAEHIPFLDTPDAVIDATYYYRWEVLTKHLVYGSPEHGYTFTEFIDRPFWSGAYGAISCPLGHQFYEIRWLKDRRVVEDFAHYWFDTPGAEPRSYSNWYGDSMWSVYQVLGDSDFIAGVLPHMRSQYHGWMAERWDEAHGMFVWDGMHDGMETNIDSRQTPQWFDGAEGYRPTLNSYLWADAVAISKAAGLLGDDATADEFARRAADLKARIQQELWDPERQFFFQQFAHDEETTVDPLPGAEDSVDAVAVARARMAADGSTPPIRAKTLTYESGPWAGDPHGREAIGFVPWQFGLPDHGYEAAWVSLMDPTAFYAPFGPTTTEKGDPLYWVSPQCCVWSGNSWPYATTQTLTALAVLLDKYDQDVVHAGDWFNLFSIYARTHRKYGRPYVAEAADPETGSWAGHDTFFHSEHYLHSGFVDLVITGLAGLRPRDDNAFDVKPLVPPAWDWFALEDVAYRGHRVAIVWDRDGTHYGRGAGLRVWIDGDVAAESPELAPMRVQLDGTAGAPLADAAPGAHARQGEARRNFAVNNGTSWFPHAEASSARPRHPATWAVDGQYWYHLSPPNRWLPAGNTTEDWIEIDFGVARPLEELRLYFVDDTLRVRDFVAEQAPEDRIAALAGTDGNVTAAPPDSFEIEQWTDDGWRRVARQERRPTSPAGRRANIVAFPPTMARKVRVTLQHAEGRVSGLSEIEAWGRAALPLSAPDAPVPDLAFNPTRDGLPRATASFDGYDESDPALVLDGEMAFNYYTRKIWNGHGSPNETDWIVIELDGEREVSAVEVYTWAWEERGVAAPRDIAIEVWTGGAWAPVERVRTRPARPLAMARHAIEFAPVRTTAVRVLLQRAMPAAVAVSEIIVRGPGAGGIGESRVADVR